MIKAILRAIRKLLRDIGSLFGGGGPASTVDDLEEVLDQSDVIESARDQAKSAIQAEEESRRRSPEQQAQLYAITMPQERAFVDLSLLSAQQQVWLHKLSTPQLQCLADTPLRRIASALRGEPVAIAMVPSVPLGDSPIIELSPIARRIVEKRKGQPQLSYFIPEELQDRV